jgi:hypothetical protein
VGFGTFSPGAPSVGTDLKACLNEKDSLWKKAQIGIFKYLIKFSINYKSKESCPSKSQCEPNKSLQRQVSLSKYYCTVTYPPRTQLFVCFTEKGILQEEDPLDLEDKIDDADDVDSDLEESDEMNRLEEHVVFDDDNGFNFSAEGNN